MPDNRKGAPGRAPLRESQTNSTPAAYPQASLLDAEGRALRDAGAELATNAVHTSWRLAAEAAIETLAASGVEWSSDDLHLLVGPPPGHASSIGGVILGASRRKRIVPVGYKITERPEGHARPIRTWIGRAA